MMDATPTASGSRQPFRDAAGQGAIVFDPARLQQASPELFDPDCYGADAALVRGKGGRGAAWFVRGSFGDGVLRHYQRGGWMARASQDGYLWQGERWVRSIREFELLQLLREQGLPVPAPVAAYYRKGSWNYRAAIIVGRLDQARSLVEAVVVDGLQAPWTAVGEAIGRCHRARAHHADLNASNILIGSDDGVCLIDWDKGRIEAAPGRWMERVLARLHRSLRKECADSPAHVIDAGMQLLRAAHDRELLR